MEEAFIWASTADIWLNVGTVRSKNEIVAADSRFAKFRIFNEGKIYNNNKRMSPGGGNDFWESGVIAPDVILTDLIQVFHPGLLNSDTLTYYREVN
jgi:iron complex transport system substrate-binding protein